MILSLSLYEWLRGSSRQRTMSGNVAACLTREVGVLRQLGFARVKRGESDASGKPLLRVEGLQTF